MWVIIENVNLSQGMSVCQTRECLTSLSCLRGSGAHQNEKARQHSIVHYSTLPSVQTKELPTSFSNPVYQTHQVVKSWRGRTLLSTENGSCQSHVHCISSIKHHPQMITTIDRVFALRKYVRCLIDIWKSSILLVQLNHCFGVTQQRMREALEWRLPVTCVLTLAWGMRHVAKGSTNNTEELSFCL